MHKAQSGVAQRCVLPDVARVGFYDGQGAPEDDLLASCVKAFLKPRGEDLGFLSNPVSDDPWHELHCYLVGMSGLGFRLACHPTKWSMADGSCWQMADDPLEPARRALAAAGYGMTASLKRSFVREHGGTADPRATETGWRRQIMASICKGNPVIAIGVIGPPEPCLITGYDDNGDVLIGWNAFQGMPEFNGGVEFEKPGYFRKANWYADTHGLIFIGDRLAAQRASSRRRPEERAISIRDALAYGLEVMRTPVVRERLTGQTAFSRWADQLLDDRQFPARNTTALRERFEVHHERGGVLAEARAYCSDFLLDAAGVHPEARDELQAAFRCFQDEHDLVWAIWEFTGGMIADEEGARKLASSYLRGRMVPLIRLARTRDAEAAAHIERAIRKIDDTARSKLGESVGPNPRATIRREGGTVQIEGVPMLSWGAGRDCPFIGGLEAATAVTERPTDYVDMMGATGLAFRVRWSNPDTLGGWDHSSAGGEFMEEWDDVQRGTGWNLEAEFPGVTQDPAVDPNAQRVRRHIDAGWPVMASVAGPDIGVIVGYSDEGRRMLIHRYGDSEPLDVAAAEACGGFQLFLDGCGPQPDPKRVLAASLRTALRNWTRGKTSAGYAGHGREWHYGEQALRVWADDLLTRDPASVNEKDGQVYRDVNRFVYLSLIDARKAAVAYLRKHAGLLSGDTRAALLAAADAYDREVSVLTAGSSWIDDMSGAWTEDHRRRQAEVLMAALNIEREALERIAAAAQALETTPPALRSYDLGHWALLPNVPRIGYHVHICPFPGSLYAVLTYIGDRPDHNFLMGVTGACFRRFWSKDDGGNVDLMYLGEEPIRRAEAALNREMQIVAPHDRGVMVDAVKRSINAGRPVIAFGIIGPPEAGLVTGYDRGGDVVMGWSYFQDASKPGYYQQSDWHARAEWAGDLGFVLIGDKKRWPGPSRRDVLLSTLRWAIDLATTERRPEKPDHLSGLAACAAWADALEVDDDYPNDDAAVMSTRVMVHADQCCMSDDRRSAAPFLRGMAAEAGKAKVALLAAADLYVDAASAKVWPWGHDMGEEARAGLADPSVRRELAAEVRRACHAETRAVAFLEEAVAAMEEKPKR